MNKLLFWITKNRVRFGWLGVPLVVLLMIYVSFTNDIHVENFCDNIGTLKSWWGQWGDPTLGVSTFLVAIIIWLLGMAKDWERKLPKYFTIRYFYFKNTEDKNGSEKKVKTLILECQFAPLPHENDIRNFGQTLGLQTLDIGAKFKYGKHLKITSKGVQKSYLSLVEDLKIADETKNGYYPMSSNNESLNKIKYHNFWEVDFFLKEFPAGLEDEIYFWYAGDDFPKSFEKNKT